MQLKSGTELQNGKYRIIKTLGQGGFGITYLAEQTLMDRLVCIKEFFIKEYCERDAETSQVSLGTRHKEEMLRQYMKKFIKEAQTVAKLDHSNVVKIHDTFYENNTAYIVMEYIDGCTLLERVRDHGPLSEVQALEYIRQVGSALSFAHGRNVAHLDVKPSNIMLSSDGRKAVLIDFGMAKHYGESGEQTSDTPVGLSHGYAPLEQYREGGVKSFSPTTDIYALGATLLYALTGRRPLQATELAQFGGPDQVEGAFSPSVKEAIKAAMRARMDARPQTVAAFLSLLSAASVPSSAPAASESATEETEIKPTPKPSPNPKPTAVPPPAPMPAPGKKPSKAWLWALLGGLAVAAIITAIVLGGRKDKPVPADPLSAVDTLAVETPAETPIETETPPAAVPGSVKLSSTPSGATIWLDGKNTKETTPEIFEDLTPGRHSIKLTLDGYNDYTGSVTVTSGKRSESSPTLTAKEKPAAPSPTPVPAPEPTPAPSAPAEKPTTGSINGHEWVDLGLPSGLKWATSNVGANSPSDYGNYYAWGETRPKSTYNWTNYKFRVSGDNWENVTFNKYNTQNNYGSVDNRTRLELSDDAARSSWGSSWRMPTDEEWTELREKCSWTWTTQGGKNGYKVTSRTNGNSIFLPAAGGRYGSSLSHAGSYGLYWSSSLSSGSPSLAWGVYFNSGGVGRNDYGRCGGRSVRPVSE